MSTAVTEAAEAAATGAWLVELESGAPIRTVAPGLPRGLFGAWAAPEEPPAAAIPSYGDTSQYAEEAILVGPSAARDAGVPLATGGGGGAEAMQKVQLDDLFSGIWLAEGEDESAAGSGESMDGGSEAAAAGRVHHQSVLAQLAALPDEAEVPGAVATATGGCPKTP